MDSQKMIDEARLQGKLAAARQLVRLHTPLDNPIDVFTTIESQGLWLLFQPLENILGAYVVTPAARGVIVTTRRNRNVQRLTAAHEYGHHAMGHGGSVDGEREIEQPYRTRRLIEVAAQAFAMDFLMPLQLVNHLWTELELPSSPSGLEPLNAYLLSLHLGVSYSATVYHLADIGKLRREDLQRFLSLQPKDIKKQLARGESPQDPWADVWPLSEADHGKRFIIGPHDELRISLPETPSTGFVWSVEAPTQTTTANSNESNMGDWSAEQIDDDREAADSTPLALIDSDFERIDSRSIFETIGQKGHRFISFRATAPGYCKLRLVLKRPWERAQPPARVFEADVEVEQRPTGDSDRGYREPAKRQLSLALG